MPKSVIPSLLEPLTTGAVLIYGLGKEGLSTLRFLTESRLSFELRLADDAPLQELSAEAQQAMAESKLPFFQRPSAEELKTVDWLLLSPGIRLDTLPENTAQHLSQTNLFLEALALLRAEYPQQLLTVGVTGSKGKSTTSAAIAKVLERTAGKTWLLGNIGKPFLDSLHEIEKTLQTGTATQVVMELSSHQLQLVKHSPQIAVLLGIFPEHGDHYPSFEHYQEAKAGLFRHQDTQDLLFYRADNKVTADLAAQAPSQRIAFGPGIETEIAGHQLSAQQESIQLDGEPWLSLSELRILGEHTLHNLLPSVLIGLQLQLPLKSIRQALLDFPGLPDRLEFVTEKAGIRYYNDSLATNPQATLQALASFPEDPVILLAGGHERDADYTELAQALAERQKLGHLKGVILFPPSGERIQELLQAENIRTKLVKSMPVAVKSAQDMAESGDIVLLSPASPSFGLFKNYKDRAEQFRSAM